MIYGRRKGPAKDLLGKRFSRLTIVSWVERRDRQNHWRCLCDCGGETVANTSNLKRGSVKSCGCLLVEFNKSHPKHRKSRNSNLLGLFYGKTLADFGLYPALDGERIVQKKEKVQKVEFPLQHGVRAKVFTFG